MFGLFGKKQKQRIMYRVYFYHFGGEDDAILFTYKSDDSVIVEHVNAIRDFLNFCEKVDYKNGKKALSDCKPWHFWIDGLGELSFARVRWDAPQANKENVLSINVEAQQFREWCKDD